MRSDPLARAVIGAHRAIADRLDALEAATDADRSERLGDLIALVHATADAEESVLFPVVRGLVDDDGVLTDTCAAEHRETADRLDAIASGLEASGFGTAVNQLARDIRHHMADEERAALPLLAEALDASASKRLAERFQHAVSG